jgi:hypothetical protein
VRCALIEFGSFIWSFSSCGFCIFFVRALREDYWKELFGSLRWAGFPTWLRVAVDFDFESKREIIRVKNGDNDEWEERWKGDYIFENEWQSFRTKKDRSLELKSVFHECTPGRRKLAVKVMDIFGNDTMTIVDVSVGKNGGKK